MTDAQKTVGFAPAEEDFARYGYAPKKKGAVAKRLGIDEDWRNATKARITTHLAAGLDDNKKLAGLFTLSGVCARLRSIMLSSHDEDINAVFNSWENGTLIVPLSLQAAAKEGKVYDDGTRYRGKPIQYKGGLSAFLRLNLPKQTVITENSEGEEIEVKVPAAVQMHRYVMKYIKWGMEELDIAELQRNGRMNATAIAITDLPAFYILVEVLEQMITSYYCFEAVPSWHKFFKLDFDEIFGAKTYNRVPEEGHAPLVGHSFEEMVANAHRVSAPRPQCVKKMVKEGRKELAIAYAHYCCPKWFEYNIVEGLITAWTRIAGKVFAYGIGDVPDIKGFFTLSGQFRAQAGLFMREAFANGEITELFLKPEPIPLGTLEELPY